MLKIFRPGITTIFLTFIISSSIAADSTGINQPSENRKQYIFSPLFGLSSDEGIILGVMAGLARPPDFLIYPSMYYTTQNKRVMKINGEVPFYGGRLGGDIAYRRTRQPLYDPVGDPDVIARADVDRVELNLTWLYHIIGSLEVGPDIELDHSRARNIRHDEDFQGIVDDSRYLNGETVLGGFRLRWSTTSPYRPKRGIVLESAFRVGQAGYHLWRDRKLDFASDFHAAIAQPVSSNLRVYQRGFYNYQYESPPPVRNHIGGEATVRGHPSQREFGRRVLASRTQLHWTISGKRSWPAKWTLPAFRKMLPLYYEVELVSFFDLGAVGDPEFGWKQSRYGYGGGFRFIVLPDLVAHFDVAFSPDSKFRLYVGVGATL